MFKLQKTHQTDLLSGLSLEIVLLPSLLFGKRRKDKLITLPPMLL